jgi:hypothetical protein
VPAVGEVEAEYGVAARLMKVKYTPCWPGFRMGLDIDVLGVREEGLGALASEVLHHVHILATAVMRLRDNPRAYLLVITPPWAAITARLVKFRGDEPNLSFWRWYFLKLASKTILVGGLQVLEVHGSPRGGSDTS